MALLERIRLRAAAQEPTPELRLGIGDDCALLRVAPDEELAVTTDLSIAGRHFNLDWHPPESIGHRALARGLSDLAAMGARPVAVFLSLALPSNLVQNPKARSAPFIDRFLDGLLALAAKCNVPLAGGDLAESALAIADVVLTGAVTQGKALLRSGARPGDLIYVTGSLGGAAAGFACLSQMAAAFKRAKSAGRLKLPISVPEKFNEILKPHLYPSPRLAQGIWLTRNAAASAAIDLSDGLSTDLTHLCTESGVYAELDAPALPIAPAANPMQALHGGEDYELLFTASPDARIPSKIEGVSVTRIGQITDQPFRTGPRQTARTPVTLITPKGPAPLASQGWQHFA
ncbi:MAG TPA: thiamine-phosphate kinase [Terracidiphilus sp.]|nr:thiamine-phosphate kinase [Terracidiphilus sp.]